MNFKFSILFIFFGFTLLSCGVKSPPHDYPDTITDSYIRDYTHSGELPITEKEKNQTPQ